MSLHARLLPHPSRTIARPPVSRPSADAQRESPEEAAIDDALGMTFPASDPPAWGCLARRRSEADRR